MSDQENNNEGKSGSVDKRRRSLTKAGLTTPVIMSIFSRPAFAQQCSGSALASGNLSNTVDLSTCGTCKPFQWRNATDAEFDSIGLARDAEIGEIFTIPTLTLPQEASGRPILVGTLSEVLFNDVQIDPDLRFKNNGGSMDIAKADLKYSLKCFAAAYLNALHKATSVNFEYQLNQIESDVNAVWVITKNRTGTRDKLNMTPIRELTEKYELAIGDGLSCAINQSPL